MSVQRQVVMRRLQKSEAAHLTVGFNLTSNVNLISSPNLTLAELQKSDYRTHTHRTGRAVRERKKKGKCNFFPMGVPPHLCIVQFRNASVTNLRKLPRPGIEPKR